MSTAIAIGASTLQLPDPGESYSLALLNTNNTNIAAEVNLLNKFAKGEVAHTEVTTNSSAIGIRTVVLNIASFNFKANRKYKVEFHGNYSCSGTTSTAAFTIGTCAVADAASLTTGITNIKSIADKPNTANEGRLMSVVRNHLLYSSDTTLQIKATIERVTGSDGFYTSCGADNPLTLTIYDMGAQP